MNAHFWNNVFENRTNPIPPEEYLVDKIHLLSGTTVLDLGAGDGRNSIYLNEKGYCVTAMDFSSKGLKKINNISSDIKTVLLDINNDIELSKTGPFDNIILNHFVPDRNSLQRLPELLNEKGILFIVAFDKIMTTQRKNTKNLILDMEQMNTLKNSMDIIDFNQLKDDRGVFNRCILRKKEK